MPSAHYKHREAVLQRIAHLLHRSYADYEVEELVDAIEEWMDYKINEAIHPTE